jgi:hypothetical protein
VNPSLDLDVKNGKILAKCRAGCSQHALMAAFAAYGITAADLYLTPRNGQPSAQREINQPATRSETKIYPYHDERNRLLYQVVVTRFFPKGSRKKKVTYRRPDPNKRGEWIYNLDSVRRVLYRLPELMEQKVVFFPEGEECANDLWEKLGLAATTSPGGVDGWRPEFAQQLAALKPELVVVLADNDPPGAKLAEKKLKALRMLGVPVKLLLLPDLPPDGGDVSDWIAAGGTDQRLLQLVESTPLWASPVADAPTAGETDDDSHPEPLVTPRTPFVIVTPPKSFITKYVEMAQQRTDAPAEAHELTAVGVLSALAGPRPRIPLAYAVDGVPLGLWVMNVADSTDARKTTTLALGVEIVEKVLGADAVLPWEGSPQAFIQKLAHRDGQATVFAHDEYSGILSQMNRGGHMAGLAQVFIRAFDGKPIENARTRKRVKNQDGRVEEREDRDRAEHPYLVKLCATTRAAFLTAANTDNVLDGLLARFVFTSGTSTPRPLQRNSDRLKTLTLGLHEHAQTFHGKAQSLLIINVTDEVLVLAWKLEQRYKAAARNANRPDVAGPSMKRLADAVLRVAALLAIDRGTEMGVTIEAGDFEVAAKLGERWQATTLDVISALGRTKFQADCDAVMSTVDARPLGIQLSALYRAHRGLRKREFDEVLDALEVQRRIKRVPAPSGGHRPPTVIYPWASAPKGLE